MVKITLAAYSVRRQKAAGQKGRKERQREKKKKKKVRHLPISCLR